MWLSRARRSHACSSSAACPSGARLRRAYRCPTRVLQTCTPSSASLRRVASGATPSTETPHRRRRPPCSPCFVLPNLGSFLPVQTRLCGRATRGGGGELAEVTGDMKGHVSREIPLFREQTAAEIDFFPLFTPVSPPDAEKKGLAWRLPAPERECNLLDAFIINRDRKLFPITRSFLSFFPPLHSHSFFLSRVLKRRALPGSALPRADQFAPNGSSRALASISRALTEHPRPHGRLGGKKNKKKEKPIWRRDHIFSVSSPFVRYLRRTKAGAGSRWGTGSGGR